MICVTIARNSRRLALAGMINAARMNADMVEVRLDRFEKQPDFAELLAAKKTPVMFSCRRVKDGGVWARSENDRLALLRQAILARPDYVAIEHDVAEQVRPFGNVRRVISYSNIDETPADIADICERCSKQFADAVQLTCKARNAEDAWSLLQAISRSAAPVVVVGLGWQGITPALVGRQFGSPWVVAATERGSEAYPGQPTVRELIDVYRFRDISRETRWIGITNLGQWEVLTIALLNATFAAQESTKRCLPLPVGDARQFGKIAHRLKLRGIVVGPQDQPALRTMAEELDDNVRFASAASDGEQVESAVDLLMPHGEKSWKGASIFPRAAGTALRAALRRQGKSLENSMVMFAGLTPITVGIARAVKKHGGKMIFADRDDKKANQYCRWFGGRHVRPEAVYTTLHDVTVLGATPSIDPDADVSEPALHPGFLKPGMTLMDLTATPRPTPLMQEAVRRGCAIVEPLDLLFENVRRLLYRMRGQEPSRRVLKQTIASLLSDVLVSNSDFHVPLDTSES